MLTLADNFRIGDFTLYRDVTRANGARALTSTFYALADVPRLAVAADGGPDFQFWWYRRALGSTPGATDGLVAAGGLLVATIDLGPTADERTQLRRDVAARCQIDGGESAVNLLPMPFVSGTVTLSFAGDAPGAPGRTARVVPASLVGTQQAAFALDLDADEAALLGDAIDKELRILHATYDMVFEYHLDGVELRVWCDGRRAQAVAQAQASTGALDVSALRSSLVASQTAGISITSERPIPPDQDTSLQQLGQQLLEASLQSTLIDHKTNTVRAYNASMAATLNFTLSSSLAAQQRTAVDGLLTLAVDDTLRSTRVVVTDLANTPRPLDVVVLCPFDFDNGLIAAVHVFIAYDGTGPDGKPIHREADFVFKSSADRFTFHTLASAVERRYRWHAEVQYRDGTRLTLAEATADDTLLILSLDRIGVLDVVISAGDVPFDVVTSAIVDLEYPPKALTHQAVLDAAHLSDRWQAVTGELAIGGLRWRPTFVTADRRRITGDWRDSGSARVVVDAPADIAASGDVQLVAAGDFGAVAQIGVDLSNADGADAAQFSFTKAGQTARWTRHAPGDGSFAYRVRRTVIATDGTTRTFDWTDQDAPLLVVSDDSRFTVQVVPRLLDLGGAWAVATVAFEHVDERDTVVLRDRSAGATWSFRLGDSDQHAYRYQLTLVPKGGGARQVLPWQDAQDEILVLRPPAA